MKKYMLAEDDVVNANEVHLCIQFHRERMAISGPAAKHPKWVIKALRAIAEWWTQHECAPPAEAPVGVTNLTTADMAIVLFRDWDVVVPPGDVFADGIASYQLAVVGTKIDDAERCVMRLLALAEQIQKRMEEKADD